MNGTSVSTSTNVSIGNNSNDLRQSQQYLQLYQPPQINGDFLGKHIISVSQFNRHDLEILFDATASIRKRLRQNDRGLLQLLAGKMMATLFYEASTRTDMSFQAAMRHLGGEVIAASNGVQFSSVYKGENLADTVRAAGCYADVVILRHPLVGSSYEAAYYLDRLGEQIKRRPVIISGGDGTGEHPSQALLDIFTIYDFKKRIDNLMITLVGDLRNGRTVHSLARLIARYEAVGTTLCLVSPESLRMPSAIVEFVSAHGVHVIETDNLAEVLDHSDVIYWTRIQEERFEDRSEYEAIKDGFIMRPETLAQARPDTILMHPLPRKHEMGTPADHDALDADPRSVYFQQMENGMFVRMTLLAKALGGLWV
ncbi:MAG: aspartate carbamoyltransferase [Chloroflexi bacterium]|nr:aspartate carbamoyltransferase [Chloroflexota bacterium]